MRVLIVSFACAPGRGSETGCGFNLPRYLARHVGELVVLTADLNRPAIEDGPPLPANLHLEYVPFTRLPGEAGHRLAYLWWLARALRRARELHRAAPFDLVHHLTYAMSWIPPLAGRLGIPLVWTAGNRLLTPLALVPWSSPRGAAGEILRNAAVVVGSRAAALSVRPEVVLLGHRAPDPRARPFFLPALQEELSELPAARDEPGVFRVVCVGRLLALKGFHLALEAFARARRPGWELVLVGSGPEEEFLRRRARELGVARAVCFPGWLERKALFDLLATASCFLLPSLHDSFSFVVLEAMAVGLPAVVLDRGGPALVVDEEVGVKVPVSRPRQVVADLARALETLASDPERRRAMGEAARRRVRERHTWEVRAQEVAALYEEVLARRGPAARPEGAG